ncbi:hypothetical protein BC777_3002 [Yoonia maricola]|uniref:Excalibur calcium-binding domain-containing protein n=1 Tax=Yoonia maricola TaxID=420999 RepID=A0A2M8W260_9RHOB|nr:hypothetical protein [Yoonia maricola]PJI85006.1 hypothetical protein BC777_3002 [Yoonia maricola]
MNSRIVIAVILIGLAACTPRVVPTERGVGFDEYSRFELERARREAQLSAPRGTIVPPAQVSSLPVSGQTIDQSQAIPSSALAAAGIGTQATTDTSTQTSAVAADPLRTQGLQASPSNPAPDLVNAGTGLSDEQSFDAVSERETIESDAQRRAAQAAAREQITPTAVPQRPSNTGPNIVEYAVNAPNVKGQEWYSRSLLSGDNRFRRNCAEYATPDDAQRDFLARGGPERDRRGIDPDGDGFACGWDPAPYRFAAGQ